MGTLNKHVHRKCLKYDTVASRVQTVVPVL